MAPKLEVKYTPKNGLQKRLRAVYDDASVIILDGEPGTGKAQPLDSVVMTPNGPVRMGDVYVGQEVCTPFGTTTEITGVYPQGVRPVYRITFSDGAEVECCEDHLWSIGHTQKRWFGRVVDTKYIAKHYRTASGRCSLYTPTTLPVEFAAREYIIDPYLMGILLADGGLTCAVKLATADDEVLSRVWSLIDPDYKWHPSGKYDHCLSKRVPGGGNRYIAELRRLGLFGHGSHEKHIPFEYLHGSVEQRTALLQGMMDGDGSVDMGCGMPEYYTTSPQLADDFEYLVNSLGGICSTSLKKPSYYSHKYDKRVEGKLCFVIRPSLPNDVKPFFLSRKAEKLKPRTKYFPRRRIVNVELVEAKPVQCISVADPSHLYLTDRFIVTHNTAGAIGEALVSLAKGDVERIILCRPPVPCGPSLGYLTGDLVEKMTPWLASVADAMRGFTDLTFAKLGKKIEIADIGMVQGRTVAREVLIVDEASNLFDRQQCVCLATRVGEGGKVILCGDPNQSNIRVSPNPFAQFAIDHRDTPGVAVVTATREDQLRSGFVKDFLDAEDRIQQRRRRAS